MSRGRRLLLVTLSGALGVLAMLTVAGAIDNRLHRDDTLRHVTVGGVDVGTRSPAELRVALTALEPQVAAQPVELVGNERTLTVDAARAGLTIDVEATAAAAMRAGRGRFAALGWAVGLVRDREVPLLLKVDEAKLREALLPFGTPRDDSLVFTMRDGQITVNTGKEGFVADVAAVGEELLQSARREDTPIRARVNTTIVPPAVSPAQRTRLADLANQATATAITLKLGETTKTVEQRVVRSWLRPTADGQDFTVEDTAVRATATSLFTGVGGAGRDAKIAVFAGQVLILEGEPATRCCNADTSTRVDRALHARTPTIELAFAETPRPKGREWAANLGVKEVVGEFTTRYPAGQPRVINIKRIAELTQGVVIEPGKSFSINDFVGRRTVEKGFVPGGVIQDGVFQEDVGGGISQYATTLFNAAFFGGLDFASYQSHSIYITRYPYGREATVSFPQPDLVIQNTTPYGVLLWPTATDTGITVQLWSTKYATGAQTNQTEKIFNTACTRVTTERTRTYVDGRAPKIDSVTAIYQKEGIDCSGNPTPGATTTTTTTTPPPTTTTTSAPPTTAAVPPPTTVPLVAPPRGTGSPP